MKKIWLEIEDFSKSTEDWKQESYEDGIKIGITAWDSKEKKFMIDEHVASLFRFMTYRENYSLEELKDEITKLGFKII